jgi:cytochrome bd-type quinol oxidase subunit 2
MKKQSWQKLFLICFYSAFLLFSSVQVQASGLGDAFGNNLKDAAGKNFNTETSLDQIIGTVIQSFLSLLGVIFLILIIYAGITWMTAGGDEPKVEKAQKILKNAIIGLIIIVSAYAISYFVINALSENTLVS